MKIFSILNRYVFTELIPPFLINLLFFTFIFLLARILDITNMIVNYKVGLYTVFRMILFTMPYFLVYVIPMSVMMSILLTFLRMSGDNEIVALKAGGVSVYQLLPPVILFCMIGVILTATMTIFGLPWGKISVRQMMIEIASTSTGVGLKERTFIDNFKGVMMYVNKIDIKNKTLIDVFIEDQRTKNAVITIIAPKGRLYSEPDRPVFHLSLFNGTIIQVNPDSQAFNFIRFESYDINLDVQKAMQVEDGPKDENEMMLSELMAYLKNASQKNSNYYDALMEFHKKFSIPFACLAMGILAVPLGVHSRTSKRSYGLGLGLLFFLFYYLLLSIGSVFGETGAYPPIIGMWVPNIVTGGIGIYLLVRTVHGRPLMIDPYRLISWISRFRHKNGNASP